MKQSRRLALWLRFSLLLGSCWSAWLGADETPVFRLTLKDHLFSPSTLQVPAGQKVKIIIHNQDPNPEEFESFSMNREKVILGGSSGVVFVGPLQPGTYPFSGEYNPDSAKGQLIALPEEQWQALQAGGR
ncbi:cupredoxin domain-containing protein [Rheinheimera sp.]|uniref:cupredoxin domain-containing protein n=1 Tax=Rheinheimera sp. TaxID=1869214 RepID=UPI003D28933B